MEEMAVYEQLTISDWLEMKERLRRELQSVTESFVRIGYALRKIDDQKMYEADGYKSVAEFAKAEYGLEASTVSRFMSINREYSIEGYSERLRPEYIGMGQSKLSEMLQLPEADRALITPETQREDIRDLKRFNKEGPVTGEADDITELIEAYFKTNKGDLNELYSMGEKDPQAAADLLNPSGSKAFKKGLYMMFFYEDSVKIKKFGENPVAYTWLDFLKKVDEIFGPAAAGDHTWERYFGEEEIAPAQNEPEESVQNVSENDQEPEQSDQEPEQNDQKPEQNTEEPEKDAAEEAEPAAAVTEIAPAQKEEPAAAVPEEPIHSRYVQGDEILLRGKVDMVSVTSGTVNYRIKTESGKTVWCVESDIWEEETDE